MRWFRALALCFGVFAALPVMAQDAYKCGGAVESRVWAMWDTRGRQVLRENLGIRLIGRGDTYTLYDMQVYFHNLESMAQRCAQTERLIEMAGEFMAAYDALNTEMAWICKGGEVCSSANQLINTEVMLVSVQGLGLMSALAQAMATSKNKTARQHPFIEKTVDVSLAHLKRWGSDAAVKELLDRSAAKPEDVKGASSSLFFTEKELWQVAIYANVASIMVAKPKLQSSLGTSKAQLSGSLRALLKLTNARTSLESIGGVTAAQFDRGFWRVYPGNRYAGYTGDVPPVSCETVDGVVMQTTAEQANNVPIVVDIGWDISHARRLVHAIDALERGRGAIKAIFGITEQELPSESLAKYSATQMVGRLWNGDKSFPLFSNYWNGSNGWYNAGGEDGASCDPGYPPFALVDAFATGGYAVWSKQVPTIGELAKTIHALTESETPAAVAYTQKHFSGLSAGEDEDRRMIYRLMFWPSLVQ